MALTKIIWSVWAAAAFLILLNGYAATEPAARGENHIILVGHGVPASDYPEDRR